MIITETPFKGLYEIDLKPFEDERGWFMRFYDSKIFRDSIPDPINGWKQMNHAFNALKFTWRGFHFQKHPYQETKLVRCLNGSILDCVLDLRQNSSTYLQVYHVKLSRENRKMLYIPKGFAHGYLTLEDSVELFYLHDEFYMPEYESGVNYKDERINFKLPIQPIIVSVRDKNHPKL